MTKLPVGNAIEQSSGRSDERLRVAVLMGGASSERGVSLNTGRQIVQSLDKAKYKVTSIDTADLQYIPSSMKSVRPTHLPSGHIDAMGATNLLAGIDASSTGTSEFEGRPDVVFVALHGKGGEDGSVQGLLEVLGLPYTGSGVLASAVAMNKTMSKRLFSGEGIPVIPGITVSRSEWYGGDRQSLRSRILDTIGCPAFVKPNSEGSTFGCTLVAKAADLGNAIEMALGFDEDALIEKYIPGTEITVAVLEEPDGGIVCLPPVEIIPTSEYYDYESKYAAGGSEHIIPARITEELTALSCSYASRCHRLLGCRGMSRTDMIVSDESLYILEVNTIPGMTPTSLLPQAAAYVGISFSDLLDRMIDSAMRR